MVFKLPSAATLFPPHVVVTSNNKIILLMLPKCNFVTVINCNVIYDMQAMSSQEKGTLTSKRVATHKLRTTTLGLK